MRTIFFGSSDFAVPSLRILKEAGLAPLLVVTKPDAPRGRGKKIYEADVKLGASELGIEVAQPDDVHAPDFLARLRALKADLGIVISYGVILKPELLALPRLGMINAHASLLPLLRGAAPVQHAIRLGHEKTGVTIMRIVPELDAGAIQLQHETAIDPTENAGALRERLAEISGRALVEAVQQLAAGKATFAEQDARKVTWAPKVEKPDGVINWKLPASEIDLLVRAMTPKPGAQTRLGAKRFQVMEGRVEKDLFGSGIPGLIQSGGEEGIRVVTGKDLYRITRIKPDNGRNMTAGEFVRGHPLTPDARFG